MMNQNKKMMPVFFGLMALLPPLIHAQGIVVTPGTNITSAGTPNQLHIVINNGGLRNDGVANLAGNTEVQLTGNVPTNSSGIGGTGTTYLNDFEVNKSGNDAIMSGNVNVLGQVLLSSGKLILNGHTLDLGTSGSLSQENNLTCVSGVNGGQIVRQIFLSTPTGFNPGNIGLEITSAQYMGNATIRRRYQQFPLSPSDVSIRRYYQVEADNNTGLAASIKAYYLDEDLMGANENNLFVWTSNNNGVNWQFKGRDAANNTLKFIGKNGLDTLSTLTLGTQNTPLPLDLLSFRAFLQGRDGQLQWETIKEVNSSHFDVQRSLDGKNFMDIGKVPCTAGTSGEKQQYAFTDKDLFNNKNFYRLRIVDRDGKFTYSQVELLQLPEFSNKVLTVHPIPSADEVYITLTSAREVTTSITLFDITGKTLRHQEVKLEKGINKVAVSLKDYPDGSYQARFGLNDLGAIKMIKQ